MEGQRSRQRAKSQIGSQTATKQRADLGDLIVAGNVDLRRSKPTKTEKSVKSGMEKVVQYALWERGLSNGPSHSLSQEGQNKAMFKEDTRRTPQSGVPLGLQKAKDLESKSEVSA